MVTVVTSCFAMATDSGDKWLCCPLIGLVSKASSLLVHNLQWSFLIVMRFSLYIGSTCGFVIVCHVFDSFSDVQRTFKTSLKYE